MTDATCCLIRLVYLSYSYRMKLHQDAQFVPSRENISSLLARYGQELISYKPADSGIENCTVIAQAMSGIYVLRVYRQHKKSDKEIERELEFVAYLGRHSIPVALPIVNLNKESISHMEQDGYTWQAILMQYMPGGHPDYYSKGLLKSLATIQAKMHNLAAVYQPGDVVEEGPTELRETRFLKLIQNREVLNPQQRELIERADGYVLNLSNALPRGLCHLDFGSGNALATDDTVTAVLDFDDLAFVPYAMCLAYTLWDIAYNVGLDSTAPYIEVYETYRPLTAYEKDALKPLMLFRHYMVACILTANDHMNASKLARYLALESELLTH
jgi:Ser/Thr protein kinase RdoA (MazF antagonist)